MKAALRKRAPKLFGAIKTVWYVIKRLNPFVSSRYLYVFGGKFLDFKQFRIVSLKPNLYIIGAEKSGTTSIHKYLDQHPEVFMSKPDKEPQYLLPMELIKKYYNRGSIPIRNQNDVLKNQMLQGYQGERIFGESTTSYTRGRNAAKRDLAEVMVEQNPRPKLIYVVRHPLDRIISNYMHKKRGIGTGLSLDEEVNSNKHYLLTSLYGYQIRHYARVFPREDLMLIYFEDFIQNTDQVLEDVCRFLKIDPKFKFKASRAHNVGGNRSKQSDPKFSDEVFERLMAAIELDQSRIQKLWGKKPPWEFKKSDWTKVKD